MKSRDLKLWGAVLLAVLILATVHSFIDQDHLRIEHRLAGLSLSRAHGLEHDVCLCFSHGLFVPSYVVPPGLGGWSFELPVLFPAEDPRTLTKGEIFHPPLA